MDLRRGPRGPPAATGSAFGRSLPLLPAVLAFGVSFGVLAQAAGMGAEASIVMSLTTFAGSAQFAVVSVLGAGGTAVAAIGAAVLLNARYGPMALAAAPAFRGGRLRRLLEAQLLVDESWALSRREGGFDRCVLIGAGAALYVGWSGGTAIGVRGGRLARRPGHARSRRRVPGALPRAGGAPAPESRRPRRRAARRRHRHLPHPDNPGGDPRHRGHGRVPRRAAPPGGRSGSLLRRAAAGTRRPGRDAGDRRSAR